MSNDRKEQPPPLSSPFPWWCDGHNRPPQSQWLHSTLAELDENINTILEILEDNGDTFGKRAEMYYQKRPQLIKTVKDIHRSYRALADKYDQLHIKSQPSIKPSTTSSFTKDGLPQQNNDEFIEQFSAADTLDFGLSSSSYEFLSPSSSNKSTNKMGDQTEYYNNNKVDDLMIREKVCIDEHNKFELRNYENLIHSNKVIKIKENQKSRKGKMKGFFCFSLNNSC